MTIKEIAKLAGVSSAAVSRYLNGGYVSEEKLLEYAALAESASSHPISRSIQRAYGKEIDRTRVSEIEEISGNGVTAKVDGKPVAAGNDKLMKRLGITPIACHSAGTILRLTENIWGIFSFLMWRNRHPKRQSEH